MVFWPIFEIIPIEHVFIEPIQVSLFNDTSDSPNGFKIDRLLCFIEIENRYDMPFRN